MKYWPLRSGRLKSFGLWLVFPLLVAALGGCATGGQPAGVQTRPAFGAAKPAAKAQKPAASLSPAQADRLREDLRRMVASARDKVFPALVNIHVITVDYYGGKEEKGQAVGSGTIISPEGNVLTNQHVTNNGKKFKCVLANELELDAHLVGEDPLTDLAVLKLDLSKWDKDTPLPVAQFGDSDDLQIGDYVMAMGSPFALSRSVTLGIVSNVHRVFAGRLAADDPDEMQLEEGQRTGLFTQWIQHDAAINYGNSGGPLVNLRGQMVGVNELGGAGLGFAIPSNLARKVTEDLLRHGEVPRSFIGVSFKPIDKTGYDKGVLVNSVVKDEPAYRAGIRAGDVILQINDQPVTVRFPEEVPPLMKAIADLPIGSSLHIRYEREGKGGEATVTTTRLEKDRGDELGFRQWGISGMEITPKMARDRRLDSTEGVLVTGVRSGGAAALAEPPVQGGDVVLSVDGQKVQTLERFAGLYEKISSQEKPPEYLLVEFDRNGKNHVTLLKPKPDKEEDPPRELPRAWIGIDTQVVLKNLAEKLGNPEGLGWRITRVYPRTKAAESDLKVGDIIIGLNAEELHPRGMADAGMLARLVRKLRIGEQATLEVLRDGKPANVTVDLERTRITPSEARKDQNRDFDLTVRELTFFDRDENRWGDDVQGVLVSQVESAGWAGLGGIRGGDLIQRIDKYEITDLEGYRKAIEALTKAQPERAVFVVLRNSRTHFQYVEPDWKPIETDEVSKDKQVAQSNVKE